jgi:hypothetical protein
MAQFIDKKLTANGMITFLPVRTDWQVILPAANPTNPDII